MPAPFSPPCLSNRRTDEHRLPGCRCANNALETARGRCYISPMTAHREWGLRIRGPILD